MTFVIIDKPAAATQGIVYRKTIDKRVREAIDQGRVEALGICQGTVQEVVVASDVAEKAAEVIAGELNGTCPNHITCLVFVGSTSAVKNAMDAIRHRMEKK